MTCRIAERELLRSRRRRRRVSRSGLLGLLGLLRGLLRRLALLSGLLPSGIGGGGLRLLGGDGAEGDENNSGKSSSDRADHRETPEPLGLSRLRRETHWIAFLLRSLATSFQEAYF